MNADPTVPGVITMYDASLTSYVQVDPDYKAVCDLTGCAKMFGAQGRAPTPSEMCAKLLSNINDSILKSSESDLAGLCIESIIASLIARLKPTVWHPMSEYPHPKTGFFGPDVLMRLGKNYSMGYGQYLYLTDKTTPVFRGWQCLALGNSPVEWMHPPGENLQ